MRRQTQRRREAERGRVSAGGKRERKRKEIKQTGKGRETKRETAKLSYYIPFSGVNIQFIYFNAIMFVFVFPLYLVYVF